ARACRTGWKLSRVWVLCPGTVHLPAARCDHTVLADPAAPTYEGEVRMTSTPGTTASAAPAASDRPDRSRNPEPPFDKLTIGVCPDQWGVWVPEDEKQIP